MQERVSRQISLANTLTEFSCLSIPKTQKACVACNDFDHEFLQLSYRWMLQLGHEEEDGLRIYADNEASL